MPRNYYCDFCQCTFPDNVTNRRNHNAGTVHVNNRKLHYDWFQKGPEIFIKEQMKKSPCHRFAAEGYCQSGLACKYSHFSFDPSTGQTIYPPELTEWFQLQSESTQPLKPVTKKKTGYRLPPRWKVKDLPPSLKPPPSKHGYTWDNVGTWDIL